jgi:hypothetical protein
MGMGLLLTEYSNTIELGNLEFSDYTKGGIHKLLRITQNKYLIF